PTIKIIGAIKLLMYFDDHAPPHFHIYYNEFEALISIQSLEVLAGYVPNKQLKKAVKWASEHQEYLRLKWSELNPR
ncbi:MAG: DUF4160 domain-containing protein, partial [Bacteroidota bacterium]